MPRQSGLADREPCPWRIVDDVGGAFCMGCIGGGIWHTIKGAWMAPKNAKIHGSVAAVTARSPVLGGQFAVWGGLFACCDCSLTAIRQKEDPWNSIISGAVTGGVLAARAGPRQMASAALVGGVLLALIEGMGIMFSRMMAPPVPTAEDYAQAARDVTAPPTAGGLFGGGSGGSGFPTFGSSPSSAPLPPSSMDPGPAMSDTFSESDGITTFSTEATRKDEPPSSSGGWWPFGK
jgi:mitochondrial import inner membrane translocase subunit TIM17